METPASAKICTNCGKDAKKHCAGCVGGIDAHGVVVQKERYCSETCQLSAWKNHRYICKQLATRMQLYRAGQIAQDVFLAYREKTFDLRITRVEKKENDIYLYEGAYGDKEPLVPFPADLVDNAEDKKMVLTWSTCSEAVGRMSKLLKDLLRDITKEIVCVVLQPNNIRRKVVFFENGAHQAVPQEVEHCVYRVNLKHGAGMFVLDLTQSQFGYHEEPVISWVKNCIERVITVNRIIPAAESYENLLADSGFVTYDERFWLIMHTHVGLMETFYRAYDRFKDEQKKTASDKTAPLLKLPEEPFVQARKVLLESMDKDVSNKVEELMRV